MKVISTSCLTKKYGKTTVVDALSMHIEKGSIYGFLGLNGAGKTTTMRMLLGMIKPTSGDYQLFDGQYKGSEVWKNVGYMIESTHAYPDLTVEENLMLFLRYYGLSNRRIIDDVINQLNLQRYRETKARFLSLGNLQRLGIAKALMHQPQLLILDEPVNGLDPAGIVEIRELMKDMAGKGVTIFVSSHLLTEIAKIADQIGIIHQGILINEIRSQQLNHQVHKKLIISTNDNHKALTILSSENLVAILNDQGEIELSDPEQSNNPGNVAAKLVAHGLDLRKLYPWEEDLESFFLRLISTNQNESNIETNNC